MDGSVPESTHAPSFTLRPYQAAIVEQALQAVAEGKKPGLVLPTGGGKTAVMAGITRALRAARPGKILILQDRGALATQNGPKIAQWLGISHSQVGGGVDDWSGDVVMAMRQSAAKSGRLDQVADTEWAGVLIDEAHRLGSGEYDRIVEAIPALTPTVGLSATLARSDGKPLSPLDCVIMGPSIETLIRDRFLTPYRFLVPQEAINGHIRQGVARLNTVGGEYSANEAARLLNTDEINAAVVRQTQDKFLGAKDREGQGVVAFCSTIQHAEDLAAAYQEAGVDARAYHSQMRDTERDETLTAFDRGEFPVMTNPLALGEGFDCARVGAVVILRPCAHRSTFVQIVGRGLRVATSEDYPGVDKRDCIIFDYAAAVTRHRSLDCPPRIEGGEMEAREFKAALKDCPDCQTSLARSVRECPECGYFFTGREPDYDPVVADDLVRIAFGAAAQRDWHRVGAQLYLVHEDGAGVMLGDLRDGSYLAMAYNPARSEERPAVIRPVARVIGGENATRLAEEHLADMLEGGVKRGPGAARRLFLRASGFDAPGKQAAEAALIAQDAARAFKSRYGEYPPFQADLEKFDAIACDAPSENADSAEAGEAAGDAED